MISDEEGSVSHLNTYRGGAASELGANVSIFDSDDSDSNGDSVAANIIFLTKLFT